MTTTFVWPDNADGPVMAITDERVDCVLRDYAGRLIATYPFAPGRGVTMTEHAYTMPYCKPVGEAWTLVERGERWHWQRLWVLAIGDQ